MRTSPFVVVNALTTGHNFAYLQGYLTNPLHEQNSFLKKLILAYLFCTFPTLMERECSFPLSHNSPVVLATIQIIPVHTPHPTVSQSFSIYSCLLQVLLSVFSELDVCTLNRPCACYIIINLISLLAFYGHCKII